jgi:DNA invertase Pin-like site-specific DNA recombinase/peptidoglycan hydrolase-like protein with peptidoglycan-binding domain
MEVRQPVWPRRGLLGVLAVAVAFATVSPELAQAQRQGASKTSTAANCGWPAGWEAGAVRLGTGFHSSNGSRRVREVQRLLTRAGARPGPVDGLFGPLTLAAVRRYQAEHGIATTGAVGRRTLALLRDRTPRRPTRVGQPSARRPAPDAAQQAAPSAPTEAKPSGSALPFLALAAALLTLTAAVARRSWRRARGRPKPLEERGVATTPAANGDRRVLGYVTVSRHEVQAGAPRALSTAIGAVCDRRGLPLVKVIHDVEPESDRIADHPGLFNALERIRKGEASGIIVPRLSHLTGAVADLGVLLKWLQDSGAFLVALDLQLDTRAPEGRLTAQALCEVSEWERRRIARRTRSGLAATRSGGSKRSRPSVRDDPELTERIVSMRATGMSLQAIADTLNREGVPTLRGGRRWRPSSVQAAAGYKRPAHSPVALPPVRRPKRDENGSG